MLFRPDGAVVPDGLHGPGLPVRHPHVGVVLAGLDQIAYADAEAVAAGGGAAVIDQASAHPLFADALVDVARLIVGRGRDRVPALRVAGDCFLYRFRAVVQFDEAESVQPVE